MTDFSSIDRLMEFGLGIGLAQQMINTMNYSVSHMAVPGVGINCMPEKSVSYFAVINNAQAGPLNEKEVAELIKRNKITEETLMWHSGLAGWRRGRDIPLIHKLILLA